MTFCRTLISPQLQPESPELPEVEMILQDGSPAVDQKQVEEEMDVDGMNANAHKKTNTMQTGVCILTRHVVW